MLGYWPSGSASSHCRPAERAVKPPHLREALVEGRQQALEPLRAPRKLAARAGMGVSARLPVARRRELQALRALTEPAPRGE